MGKPENPTKHQKQWKKHGKSPFLMGNIGKPQESHGKNIGKPWEKQITQSSLEK